jgi:hypothetical protein
MPPSAVTRWPKPSPHSRRILDDRAMRWLYPCPIEGAAFQRPFSHRNLLVRGRAHEEDAHHPTFGQKFRLYQLDFDRRKVTARAQIARVYASQTRGPDAPRYPPIEVF